MRRRDGWYPPTESQLKWAAELEVDVPDGISSRELSGLLRTVNNQRIREGLAALNLRPGMRFRRMSDGVTYTLRNSFGIAPITAFNEKANRTVEISAASFLRSYELIE